MSPEGCPWPLIQLSLVNTNTLSLLLSFWHLFNLFYSALLIWLFFAIPGHVSYLRVGFADDHFLC
jgi:hypothetical protein